MSVISFEVRGLTRTDPVNGIYVAVEDAILQLIRSLYLCMLTTPPSAVILAIKCEI